MNNPIKEQYVYDYQNNRDTSIEEQNNYKSTMENQNNGRASIKTQCNRFSSIETMECTKDTFGTIKVWNVEKQEYEIADIVIRKEKGGK